MSRGGAARQAVVRAAALTSAAVLVSCAEGDRTPQARLSLAETLAGADTAGYARAIEPRAFDFPTDHGPHPGFRSEWWYVTGNLTAADGRDFGFQLTIFRSALAPEAPVAESEWSTNQAYMAHFTVTDVAERDFHVHERFARGAAGLAGANAEPLRVWLEDWSIQADTAGTFALTLRADAESVALSLDLVPAKPLVLQGEEGFSRKGPERGTASFYYSFTRLLADGALTVGDETRTVSGTAWLDREWSTSALSPGLVGWDWFALQLSDGWDLMVYRLRESDGGAAPESEGVLVDPWGGKTTLVWNEDILVESTGSWTSPVDGAVYPSGWRIRVPGRGWELEVEPRIGNQELDVSFRYWEGAVSVRGTGEGAEPVSGRGYVELTGYAGEMPER